MSNNTHATNKYRSKFEQKVATNLIARGVDFQYEEDSLSYVIESVYTVDFTILPNGIMIETKGVLKPADRRKMRAVKDQHPKADIRFVFQNANNKLRKGSPTSYAQWAERHGFKWANKEIPQEWIDE